MAKIKGSNGSDNILGTLGADDILAKKGDDIVNGMEGDDAIDGGSGIDTALFSGSVADYSFQWLADGYLQISGPDGVDRLTGVEFLQIGSETYSIPSGVTFSLVKSGATPVSDVSPGGISDNGNVLTFTEFDPNHAGKFFVYDRAHGTTDEIPSAPDRYGIATAVSGDGSIVTYFQYDPTFTSGDSFVYDRKTGTLTNITEGSNGSFSTLRASPIALRWLTIEHQSPGTDRCC